MMKNRIFKYVLFILIFFEINPACFALAQGDSAGQLIVRPQVKYESGRLRDPFQPYLGDKPVIQFQSAGSLAQSNINLDAFKVQGIIWGGRMPQAIINNKVLAVGGLINEAKILNIDKNGVTLSIAGQVINLPAPGYEKTSKIDNGNIIMLPTQQ